MDESLRRMAPFAVAVKQARAGYGLDRDASLAALDASLQSQTGDTAQVRMRYLLGGQPVDTVVEVERLDGRWYLSDVLRHARAALERPATVVPATRSEEHTSELQSLMRISYAVFCLKKKQPKNTHPT